jgi:hypothetical protein
MRAATGTEPIREALEVDLINLVEDRHHGLLNDFVLQRRDAQRTLPSVSLRRNNMHENREKSSAPWSDDQGRSAKAKSRTADMHVPEKSDCAAVPVNQPNKEGQPSAEVGEERAQTRENIVQSHMHPTQNRKRMSQGLDGVRKTARERKQERLTALLHHLNVELLRDSFYALQRKAARLGRSGGRGKSMNPAWQIDSSICTAGFIVLPSSYSE